MCPRSAPVFLCMPPEQNDDICRKSTMTVLCLTVLFSEMKYSAHMLKSIFFLIVFKEQDFLAPSTEITIYNLKKYI